MAGDPGSDFELWSPKGDVSSLSDSKKVEQETACLLGRQINYVRRKPQVCGSVLQYVATRVLQCDAVWEAADQLRPP